MIGSGFSGFYENIESSFVYAKMGVLEGVIDDDTTDRLIAQFDFKNSVADSSPFDYLPSSTMGNGCGSVKKGGKIIIETNGCERSNFYAFVSGFSQSTSLGNDLLQASSFILGGRDSSVDYTE